MSDVYDGGAAPGHVRDVQCNGGEDRLVDCPHKPLAIDGINNCATFMGPAGVVCGGKTIIEQVMEGITANLQ